MSRYLVCCVSCCQAPQVHCQARGLAPHTPLAAQPHPLAPSQFVDQLVSVESQHCALPTGPHHVHRGAWRSGYDNKAAGGKAYRLIAIDSYRERPAVRPVVDSRLRMGGTAEVVIHIDPEIKVVTGAAGPCSFR